MSSTISLLVAVCPSLITHEKRIENFETLSASVQVADGFELDGIE